MEYQEMLSFLKKIELFRELDENEFDELTKSVNERRYKKDDLLFRENGPREDIFIIFDGEVELFKSNQYGEELRLTYLGNGDFLGEGSLAYDSPHSISARALKDTVVLTVNKDFFTKSAVTTPKVFSNITRVISRRMRKANNKLINPAAQDNRTGYCTGIKPC